MSTSVLIIAAQKENEKRILGIENSVNLMLAWAKNNGFKPYVLINSPVDLSKLSCDRYFRYYLKSQLRETIKIFLCKHDSRLRKTRNGISVPLPKFLVVYFIGQSSVRYGGGGGGGEGEGSLRKHPEEGLCVGPEMWYTSSEMMADIGSISGDWLAGSNRRVYLVLATQRFEAETETETTSAQNLWQLSNLREKVCLFANCSAAGPRTPPTGSTEGESLTRAWVKSARLGRTACEIADDLFQEIQFEQKTEDSRSNSPVFKMFRPLLGQCKFCDNSCSCRICKETKTKSFKLATR